MKIALCVLALLFGTENAWSTTWLAAPQGGSPESSEAGDMRDTADISPGCVVEARFRGESHAERRIRHRGTEFREEQVKWALEIRKAVPFQEGTCPEGSRFELSVRGAGYARLPDGSGRYVYPEDLMVPLPGTVVKLRVRRLAVTDTRTGETSDEWLRVLE